VESHLPLAKVNIMKQTGRTISTKLTEIAAGISRNLENETSIIDIIGAVKVDNL
jgi:hypothetical protein